MRYYRIQFRYRYAYSIHHHHGTQLLLLLPLHHPNSVIMIFAIPHHQSRIICIPVMVHHHCILGTTIIMSKMIIYPFRDNCHWKNQYPHHRIRPSNKTQTNWKEIWTVLVVELIPISNKHHKNHIRIITGGRNRIGHPIRMVL